MYIDHPFILSFGFQKENGKIKYSKTMEGKTVYLLPRSHILDTMTCYGKCRMSVSCMFIPLKCFVLLPTLSANMSLSTFHKMEFFGSS